MAKALRLSSLQVGLKYGFRSGLEKRLAAELLALKVPFRYEQDVIKYLQPAKERRYTPDFILPNGIIIETKGRFLTADRQKHRLIQEQFPDLDIRFIFSNPNQRISKTSTTTYAKWCERYGFLYARENIPREWITEPFTDERRAALKQAGVIQ